MSELTEQGLLPAEHRALRELHATVRKLESHWNSLAGRLGGQFSDLLGDGASEAHDLLRELEDKTAAYDLYGTPVAQSVGAPVTVTAQAWVRNASSESKPGRRMPSTWSTV